MSCYICGYPSVLKCRQCGRSVCGRHFNYDDGKCVECHDEQYEVVNKPKIVQEVKPAVAPEVKPFIAPEKKVAKKPRK